MVAKTPSKETKNGNDRSSKWLLISIGVIGSSGPIRLVVDDGDLVSAVVKSALKTYALQDRLPVLGSNDDDFLLYCCHSESRALNPWEKIGSHGVRKFLLFKIPQELQVNGYAKSIEVTKKVHSGWKSWLPKSFDLKISSH